MLKAKVFMPLGGKGLRLKAHFNSTDEFFNKGARVEFLGESLIKRQISLFQKHFDCSFVFRFSQNDRVNGEIQYIKKSGLVNFDVHCDEYNPEDNPLSLFSSWLKESAELSETDIYIVTGGDYLIHEPEFSKVASREVNYVFKSKINTLQNKFDRIYKLIEVDQEISGLLEDPNEKFVLDYPLIVNQTLAKEIAGLSNFEYLSEHIKNFISKGHRFKVLEAKYHVNINDEKDLEVLKMHEATEKKLQIIKEINSYKQKLFDLSGTGGDVLYNIAYKAIEQPDKHELKDFDEEVLNRFLELVKKTYQELV